jgi:hypothetical protein
MLHKRKIRTVPSCLTKTKINRKKKSENRPLKWHKFLAAKILVTKAETFNEAGRQFSILLAWNGNIITLISC